MSLVRVAQAVRPDKIGQPPSVLQPAAEAAEDFWSLDHDTTNSNRIPRGAIVFGFAANPAMYPNWVAGSACGLSQGSDTGLYFSESSLVPWRGATVEVYLVWAHSHATLTGDARLRLDLGPRQNKEAAGAPNDAASQRQFTTVTVASSPGQYQHAPRYDSLGQFTIDADDVVLIGQLYRLGADGADTFASSIYVHGLHVVKV